VRVLAQKALARRPPIRACLEIGRRVFAAAKGSSFVTPPCVSAQLALRRRASTEPFSLAKTRRPISKQALSGLDLFRLDINNHDLKGAPPSGDDPGEGQSIKSNKDPIEFKFTGNVILPQFNGNIAGDGGIREE